MVGYREMSFTLLAGDKKVIVSQNAIVESSQLVRDYIAMVSCNMSSCVVEQTDIANGDSCNYDDSGHLQSTTQSHLESLSEPQQCHQQMMLPDRYVDDVDEYARFLFFRYDSNDAKFVASSDIFIITNTIIEDAKKSDSSGGSGGGGGGKKGRKKRYKEKRKIRGQLDSLLAEHKSLDDKVELKLIVRRLELADYLQADDYFSWCLESCLFRYWSHHVAEFYSASINCEVLERIVICLPYMHLPQSYRDDMNFMVRWVRHNLNKRVVFDGEYCHHIIATEYKSDDTEEVTQFILTGSTDNDSGVRDVWLTGYSSNYNAIYDQSIKFRDNKVEFIYNSSHSPPIRNVIINAECMWWLYDYKVVIVLQHSVVRQACNLDS